MAKAVCAKSCDICHMGSQKKREEQYLWFSAQAVELLVQAIAEQIECWAIWEIGISGGELMALMSYLTDGSDQG
ncbi:hypothetical protein [Aeromonas sobria]|uniref:hypothetical protein n=1 Tax=Aeromonas sobria TaxID=646 RepID=UPI003F396275